MSDISRFSAIEPHASIINLFPEVPGYAIDALWMEWGRRQRRNPPESVICTTAIAYQSFCKLLDDQGDLFPGATINRSDLVMLSSMPTSTMTRYSYRKDLIVSDSFQSKAGFQRGETKSLDRILAAWEESDNTSYVAFTYTGRQYADALQAVTRKLSALYNKLGGSNG